MSRGDFDFIANVHPNLIIVPTNKSFPLANLDVLTTLNNQINDFTIYDNWKFENQQFVFSENRGDSYLDMIIIIYRAGHEFFYLDGGIATLGFNGDFTTHDDIKIHSEGLYTINRFCSGITTRAKYPLTLHLSHEFGHYLFGGDHAYYGLMTGKLDYLGGTGAMNSWERKKLGYINYYEATYNGIPKTLDDYVTTGDVLRITIPFNSPTATEYYLIENHQKVSIYDAIINGGSTITDPTLGKGIYIWKIVENENPPLPNKFPPFISAITADGSFNWQYVGDYYAGPGWYVNQPWEGYLPKTIRSAVNRHAGKTDRDPNHINWNNHIAQKWVDQNKNNQWYISRNVMGDEYDAFNVAYNELLTPWSSPSTTKIVNGQEQPTNISLQVVSQSQDNKITVKAFSTSASAQALAPSRPQLLQVTRSAGNHPMLTWTANIEPDISGYKIYKKVAEEFGWVYKATTSSTSYEDYSENYCPQGQHCAFDHYVNYRITAIDTELKESVPSDYVRTQVLGLPPDKIVPDGETNILPTEYSLSQNFPNPFNPSTIIRYTIPENSYVTLKVHNILGQEVTSLISEYKNAGEYEVSFDASSLSSGVYIYTISASNNTNVKFRESKRMLLMK